MSIRPLDKQKCPLDKQKCPLDIQMSVRPLDEQKCPLDIQMSIRPLDKQKCPLDIQMSIRPLDEQKCPLDIQMSIRPLDEWTLSNGKQSSLQSTWGQTQSNCYYSFIGIANVTCPLDINKCPFHWTNRNVHWTFHSSIGRTEMSIGHSNVHSSMDEQKCPLDIQMSTRPLDEWTNGHCLMATTLVSYPHGVRLSQITSLQLPWHCKRYMSIGHK